MGKLIFATNNPHKLEEVREMLGKGLDIVSLEAIGCRCEIPETADTLEGNALMKARFVHSRYHCDCFADDTGLEIKALHNAPGVYSARYAGLSKDFDANMQKALRELKGVADRSARFRTVIALIRGEEEILFEGIVNGVITEAPCGNNGFGYDPIFIPDGYSVTFAEMSAAEKNEISHRAMAIEKLKFYLHDK
ncbi:MAG: non-canonical purine NTP diphosphatase [Dysgonamonadaceae bacterium]|nr:non-canonical purine NTP diphosphatase [Dysgonamonadaceae bacterium]